MHHQEMGGSGEFSLLGSDNDPEYCGGGKDDSANMNHEDSCLGLNGLTRFNDPVEIRQGPRSVIHPYSP